MKPATQTGRTIGRGFIRFWAKSVMEHDLKEYKTIWIWSYVLSLELEANLWTRSCPITCQRPQVLITFSQCTCQDWDLAVVLYGVCKCGSGKLLVWDSNHGRMDMNIWPQSGSAVHACEPWSCSWPSVVAYRSSKETRQRWKPCWPLSWGLMIVDLQNWKKGVQTRADWQPWKLFKAIDGSTVTQTRVQVQNEKKKAKQPRISNFTAAVSNLFSLGRSSGNDDSLTGAFERSLKWLHMIPSSMQLM